MHEDIYIPNDHEHIVDLNETRLNHKIRRSNVIDLNEEVIVNSEYTNENSKSGREIITSSVYLGYVVIKTIQNIIQNLLSRNNSVGNGYTFQLNVKQLYKPKKG
jgi:hypothetical protein